MKIGGGIYETPAGAIKAAAEVLPAGVDYKLLAPDLAANGWSWEAELTRQQLHEIAQRTRDPSTLHPAILNGIEANEVGPFDQGRTKWLAEDGNPASLSEGMGDVETTFQDIFGATTEQQWERTTDEHGGRIFRKIEKEPPLIALMDDASTVAIRRRMIEEGRRGPITNEDAEKELFRK